MKQTCAVLICKEVTAQWEILFTPMQEIVSSLCEAAGIPAIFSVSEQEWRTKQLPEALFSHKDFLLIESDRPYITQEELQAAYAMHQSSERARTLFSDDGRERESSDLSDIDSQPCGWYTTAQLKNGDSVEYAPVENLTQITDRTQLAAANEFYRTHIIVKHLEAGVHIPIDHGVMIGPKVLIGKDTEILPGTILKGTTTIGQHCEIGPNTQLTNMEVADHCQVVSSFAADSVLREKVSVGPMANIRYGCDIGTQTKIGDFVELKNANIGSKTSVAHLTYLGDCTIGSGCNFGCGATVVNYDGTTKHHTTIGDHVFIGCNCSMVAPLTIGDGAYAAAGSVITEDVPADALVIARSRQTIKPEWNKQRGLFQKKE